MHHGALDDAKARLKKIAARRLPSGVDLEILFVDGPLSDADWERLGGSVHAKISKAHSNNELRRQRMDRVRALELRTTGDVARLLSDRPAITPLDQFRRSFADVPGWFNEPDICIWDSLLTLQSRSKVLGNFLEIGVWMGRSALSRDLALASSLLGERAIITVDDFFSPVYPQITFAVIDYIRAHPKSLMMILCGFDKGYLCHPSDSRWLLEYVAISEVWQLRH